MQRASPFKHVVVAAALASLLPVSASAQSQSQPPSQPQPRSPSSSPNDPGAAKAADRATSAQGGATGQITGTPGGVQDRMTGPSGASERTDARAGSLSLHHADRRFLARAHADGLMEIEAGRLAQERAGSDAVRAYGRRMVEEHGKANARLAALAKDKGVVLVERPGPAQRRQLDGLSKRSGADFDRDYLSDQVRNHDRVVQRYEGQVRGGRDQEVVRFAEQQLTSLREHGRQARELLDGLPRGGGAQR